MIAPKKELGNVIRKSVMTHLIANLVETITFLDWDDGSPSVDSDPYKSIDQLMDGVECHMSGDCSTNAFQPTSRFHIRKSPYPSVSGDSNVGHFIDEEANTVLEKIRVDFKTNPIFDPSIRSFLRIGLMEKLIQKSMLLAKIDRERLTLYRLPNQPRNTELAKLRNLIIENSPILRIGALHHHLNKIGKKIIRLMSREIESCSFNKEHFEENCMDPIDLYFKDEKLKLAFRIFDLETSSLLPSNNETITLGKPLFKMNLSIYFENNKTMDEIDKEDKLVFMTFYNKKESNPFFNRLFPNYLEFLDHIPFKEDKGSFTFETHLLSLLRFTYQVILEELYLITTQPNSDVLDLLEFEAIRGAVYEQIKNNPLESTLKEELFRIRFANKVANYTWAFAILATPILASFIAPSLLYSSIFASVSTLAFGRAIIQTFKSQLFYQDSILKPYSSINGPALISEYELNKAKQSFHNSLIHLAISGIITSGQVIKFISEYEKQAIKFMASEGKSLMDNTIFTRLSEISQNEISYIVNMWKNPELVRQLLTIALGGMVSSYTIKYYRDLFSSDENKSQVSTESGSALNPQFAVDIGMMVILAFMGTPLNFLESGFIARLVRSTSLVIFSASISSVIYNYKHISEFAPDWKRVTFEAIFQLGVSHWLWELKRPLQNQILASGLPSLHNKLFGIAKVWSLLSIYILINQSIKQVALDQVITNKLMIPIEFFNDPKFMSSIFETFKPEFKTQEEGRAWATELFKFIDVFSKNQVLPQELLATWETNLNQEVEVWESNNGEID